MCQMGSGKGSSVNAILVSMETYFGTMEPWAMEYQCIDNMMIVVEAKGTEIVTLMFNSKKVLIFIIQYN